jgi:hypothetical protein
VLHHLLTGAAPGDSQARAVLPKALRRVVDRALAPSPDRRYRTAASFAEALAGAAEIPSWPRRDRFRRARLAGTIGVSLLAAGIWLGWSRHRADGAGARSEQEVGMRAPKGVRTAPARSAPPGRALQEPREPQAPPPPVPEVVPETAAAPKAALSPFRRSHPWAAHPDGRFYFPSSCPLALDSPELLYFKTEQEARATGRSKSTEAGCS